MSDLIKYEKQLVVETFDKKVYFIEAKNYHEIKKALNTNKFLELHGELVNVSVIKRVYMATLESELTFEQRELLQKRIQNFEARTERSVTEAQKANMIANIKSLAL